MSHNSNGCSGPLPPPHLSSSFACSPKVCLYICMHICIYNRIRFSSATWWEFTWKYRVVRQTHYPLGLSIWIFAVTFVWILKLHLMLRCWSPWPGNESVWGFAFGDAGAETQSLLVLGRRSHPWSRIPPQRKSQLLPEDCYTDGLSKHCMYIANIVGL